MIKIIQVGEKFTYKEIDEAGNSVRTGEEMFATEAEAQEFVDKMGQTPAQTPAEVQAEATTPEASATPEPAVPEGTVAEGTPSAEGSTAPEAPAEPAA